MKIERITKKSLLETIKAEGLEKVGAFIDGKEIVREPGIIGEIGRASCRERV